MMNANKNNPANTICPLCRNADKSPDAWPCRSCKRIHEMEDYFEPNDDAPTPDRAFPEDHSTESAKRLMAKFSISCANCPATVVCMARYADQPEEQSDNCVDAFALWLKQGVRK